MKDLYSRILSLGSTYTIGNLVHQALSVVLLPLYTSYLSLADFGILALMDLTIFLINRILVTPFLSAFGRFYYKPEYEPKNGIFLFNLFSVLIIKTVFLAILYWPLTQSLNSLLFDDGQELVYVVQVYILILIFQPLSIFLLQVIRIREMARYYVFISLSKVILTTGVIVYLLTSLELGLLAIIYGNIFGLGFEVLLSLPVLLKYSNFKVSPSIVYQPLRYGYPMILSGYSNVLIEFGDRYLLSIFASVSSVGLYSFGYKIARLINMLLIVPVKQSVTPIIFQKENNIQEQKQLVIKVTTYYYFIGVFMALGLSLVAEEVIVLLASQPEFWSAWTIVPIIAFSYVQLGLGSFLQWGLILKNKSNYVSALVFVGALLNIGLNLFLIPRWHVIGAAFATLIAYSVLNGLYIYYSAKFYDLHFELKRLGYVSVVGVGLYLGSLFIANTGFLPLDIIIKLLILPFYPLTFFLTGFFNPVEKRQVQKLWRQSLKIFVRQTELPVQ